ncbi:GspE/PulE family protein [Thiomicrorhabdus indica]|uniref:GspE/PulE family protein n=1 Tax=Thiomicrorhabdus indica TaxID=2267253 RepID=UPI00102D70F6|nr:ATPase, T2SS/T4P/T4SS family [Thiomicrorhabdus indica]
MTVLIDDIHKVPAGKILSFADISANSDEFNNIAILIGNKHNNSLLVDNLMLRDSKLLELKTRLRNRNIEYQSYSATSEVIRSLRSMDVANDAINDVSQAEKVVWNLIEDAVKQKTSDIHIETRGGYCDVFFRIDSLRVKQKTISKQTAESICNILYQIYADSSSKDVTWSADSVKDASINYVTKDNKQVQIRFNSAPIYPSGNFQIVTRLLIHHDLPSIAQIGYSSGQVLELEEMMLGAQGAILLVGPTNSGKTTSLHSIATRIQEVRGENIKLVSVEDPVEYVITGACQMGVSSGRKSLQNTEGSVYGQLMKATLRQDADVVMLGEVRDEEAGRIMKDLSLAGRKILSTLHASDAMAAFMRLREIGVPENILFMKGFLSGVIYQRLIPKICPDCSLNYEQAIEKKYITEGLQSRLAGVLEIDEFELIRFRNRDGCECSTCNSKGTVGLTVASEFLPTSTPLLSAIKEGEFETAFQIWNNFSHLQHDRFGVRAVSHALTKVLQGVVDPHDVEISIGLIKGENL